MPDLEQRRFPALRWAISGGAPCPVVVIERFLALGWTFTEGFGMTELSPAALFLDAADVVTRAEFRQADSRFHVGLAGAARSERLQEAIQASRGELFIPRDLLPFEEPVAETLRDHRAIAAAVRRRDAELAATEMREHLERSRRQLRVIVFGDDDPASTTA